MAAFEDPKKAAELYKGLINDGYTVDDIGTEEQFVKGIENKKIAKQIYDGLITDGYTPDEIGEEDKFMSTFTKKQLTSKIVFDEPAAPEKPAEFESVDPLRQIGIKAYMRKMKEIDQKVDDLTGLAITPQGLTENKAIPEIGKLKKKEIEAAAGPDGSQFTRLYEDFKDLPEGNEVDYAKYQKELQENPESYTRSVAALKWQRGLANAIAAKEGQEMGGQIYSRLLQMHRYGGSYIQRKEVTNDLIRHVRKYVDNTDKQEEIIKNIALDRAESYGSQLAFGNEVEMAINPLSDRLNKYQLGYIDFLESIDPNRANAFKRTLGVDQETVKASVSFGNQDMLIGYEKDAREAEAGGVMLAMNTVTERLQKFMLKAKEVGGVQNLNMAEASEVKTLMEKYTELESEINSQPNRYPTTKVMDTARMMQEAMGESNNSYGKRFILNIGQGIDNTFSFVETMGYKIFGSDKDLAEHELRQIGKSETFSSLQSYVPNEIGFSQQRQVFDFSAIQDQIDEIKDSNLSGEQKQDQIQKLMIDNYAQVATVENPNSGKINWTGTGMMEGMNTVISQMIPMVATGYIMPGASASKMSKFKNLFTSSFLTTYEQTKVENLKNKVKNPELRAFVTTVITSAAEGMNLDLPMFKRMFGKGKGLVSKIANEVTQAEWDAAVESATGGFKAKLANFAKATAGNIIESGKEGFTEGLGSGADAIVGNVAFGEDNDPWKIATDDFMITVVGLGIPSLAGVPFRYRSIGMDVKYSVWEMGANAAKFRDKIQQQLEGGEIDPAAAQHWNTVIDRSEKAVNATPPLKANGKPFTDSQKANYAFNMFTKEEVATQGENAPEPLKKKLDEVTAEADAQNNDIVSGKDDERIVKEAEKVLKGEPEQISQPIELDPRLPEDMPADGQQEFNSAPYKKRIDEVNNDDSIPAAEREKKKDEIMKEWAQAEEEASGPKAKVKSMQLRPLPELQAELDDLKKKREEWVKQGKHKYDPEAFADLEDQIAKWEKSVSDSKAGKTTREVVETEPATELGNVSVVGDANLKNGDKIQWDVFGNEESGEWTVGEKTKTRGGKDAVELIKRYVTGWKDGKSYTKEFADKNGIAYKDEHTVTHIVPIDELRSTKEQPSEQPTPSVTPFIDEEITQLENDLADIQAEMEDPDADMETLKADFEVGQQRLEELKAEKGAAVDPVKNRPSEIKKRSAGELSEAGSMSAKMANVMVPEVGEGGSLGHAGRETLKYGTDFSKEYPDLAKHTNDTLDTATAEEMWLFIQMSHPTDNGFSVDRQDVLKEFVRRGEEIFKELGLPTDRNYPVKNKHTGSISNIRTETDFEEGGKNWWALAGNWDPVLDIETEISLQKKKIKELESKVKTLNKKKDLSERRSAEFDVKRAKEAVELLTQFDPNDPDNGDGTTETDGTTNGDGNTPILAKKKTPKKNPKQKVGESPQQFAKRIYDEVNQLDDPTDARGMALAYFAGGGKLSEASLRDEVVGEVKRATLNTGKKEKKSQEVKARDYVTTTGPSITKIAHSIWDDLPENIQQSVSDQDIRNELISVANTHNTRLSAAIEYKDSYTVKEVRSSLSQEESDQYADADIARRAKLVENLPEVQQQELIKLIEKYENQYGIVDWDKLEADTGGFDPDILSLSPETQKSLDEIIRQHNSKPDSKADNIDNKNGVSEKAQKEKELTAARSDLDAAARKLSTAQEKIAKNKASQTDMFGATQQPGMFAVDATEANSILNPLKEAVKIAQAKVDTLSKELKVIEDAENPDIFNQAPAVDQTEEPAPATDKATKRKIRDEKARKEIDDALNDFFNSGSSLTSGGIDPVKLEKGVKVVSLYVKQGVTKFADIIEDAYEKFGDMVKDMYAELKSAYGAYYNNAPDEEADVMDANIRSIKFTDIIKLEENVSDRPGNQPGYSGDSKNAVPADGSSVSGNGRGSRSDGVQNQGRDSEENRNAQGSEGSGDVFTPIIGEQGDQQLPESDQGSQPETADAGAFDGRGNRVDGTTGVDGDDGKRSASIDKGTATVAKSFKERQRINAEKQKQAESIPAKAMDEDNIRETLPYLLPEQQDDVIKAEKRFFSEEHKKIANGKGMMFTNGTGTGKTFTGLGIVKRFVKMGKGDVLIITPSQPKVEDWSNDGKALGLNIMKLDGTNTGGRGVVVTTFANFRANEELMKRDFDLIVYDESHRLMEDKKGSASSTTAAHYMAANKDFDSAMHRLTSTHPVWKEHSDLMKRYRDLNQSVNNDQAAFPEETEREIKAIGKRIDQLEIEQAKLKPGLEARARASAENTKVVFLSATPFKSHFNLRYANGFLFNWGGETITNDRGSRVDAESRFFLDNFGSAYEWKYHRLQVRSDSSPDAVAMQEIAFSEKLMKDGVMSGRAIESDRDYSREFPKVAGFNSESFNKAFNDIFNYETNEFSGLQEAARDVFFNYNYTTQLFESLKTSMGMDRIKKHIALGRQVVIFHRRKQANATPPFQTIYDQTLINAKAKINDPNLRAEDKAKAEEAINQAEAFADKYNDLFEYEQDLDYRSAIEQIEQAFPGRVGYINGDISVKNKNAAIRDFNTDGKNPDIIVVQEEAGKEGISLHDVTGNRQRILMSMSMPISTTTALQVEGRIYRIGQESDAIFEYPLLGLDLETAYFGQNINRRLSTTENLAMGNASRDLIRSYAEGVLFNSSTEDPHLEQGKGGKEYDKREASAQSEFQKAKLVYATNQKKTGRRDQREGVDYFATAEPLGQKMVEWAYLRPTEHGMEPSAGHGAIAMWFPNYVTATSIEPSFDLYSKLTARAGGGTRKILNQKFEDHNIINKYNGIVMNPPFGASGKMAMDHIEKAFKHLAEGGRIVALIPNGGAMQKRLDDFLYGQDEKGKAKNPNAFLRKEILLPSVAFQQAGTTVNTKIVVIDKIANPDAVNEMNQGTIDLRDVKTIGELFDSIEFIDMPDRVAKQVDQAVIQTAAASAEPSQSGTINPIEETKHTQTNATIYSAKASRYLGDDYRSIDAKAKQNGGYYSRFTKSWLFKTKESAEKFRLEVNGNEESQTDSQVNESEQSLGDKIRDMKINLGGGLQSNIAGLPIALYNAAVETVALAVDAGETLAAAIKKAVDKHKLKDEPDFDLNEFSNLSATAAKVYSMSPGKQKPLHGATKAEIIDSYKGKTYTDSQRAMARKKFQDARKKNENSKSMFSRLKNWFGNISQHIDNPNRFVTKLQKDIGSYYGADTGKIPLGRVLEQNSTGKSLLEVEGFLKDVMKGLNKKSVLAGGNQTLGDDFHDYVMAKRVMDRLAQETADSEVEVDPSSRSTGNITMDDAQAILNEIEKAGLTSMFDEKANAMQVKANQMLERMVMAGIISAKTFVEIKAKNDFYAPFAVVQNIQRQDDGLKVKYTAATIIKKIKGITAKSTDFGLIELANMQDSFSNGQITAEEFFDGATNLLDTLLADDKISQEEYDMEIEKLGEAGFRVGNIFDKFANMLYDSHRIAEKNKNLLKIADLASIDKEQMFAYVVNEKEGYQIKVPEGWGSIAYRDNGKIRHLVVNENAAKALQGLNDAGKSLFRSFVNTINKGLRFGAITASVNFQAVNFAIDLVRNGTVSRYGIFTGKGGADRLANTLLFVPQYVETLLVALYENIGRPLLKTVGVNADHTRLYKTFMNSQGYSSGAYDNPFKQDKRELKIHGPSAIQNVKESAGRIFGLIEGLGRSLEESHKMVAMERGMDVEGLKRVGISRLKNMVMASKSPQDLAAALDSVAYEMQNMAGSPHFQATSAFMKTMSLVFQFFSARVKGQLTDLRRLANMFGLGGEGVKLSAGERGTLLAQFALVAIPIVLNSINNYSDDDDEKERKNNMSEFDRNKNILVKIGEFDNGDGVSRPDYLKISARDIPALINHAANGVVEYIKHEDPESLKLMAKKISGEISPLDLEFEKKKYPGDVRSEGVLVESGISNMTPFFKYPYELAANRNSRYHSAILPYSLMQEYKKGRIAPYEVVKKNAKGQVTTKPWAISVSKILHENGIEWPAALIDHAENTLIGNVVDNTSDVGSGTGMEQRFIRSKSKYPVVPQKTE